MSGRFTPVTLFNASPVPFVFAALMGPGVSAASGATGVSEHASPTSSGRASAVVRSFMDIAPFQNGEKAIRPPVGGRNDHYTSARTFNCPAGRARPAARGDGPNPYVLPLLFYVTTLVLALRIGARTVSLAFLLLHGARLVRTRLPRVIRVESHIISVIV